MISNLVPKTLDVKHNESWADVLLKINAMMDDVKVSDFDYMRIYRGDDKDSH